MGFNINCTMRALTFTSIISSCKQQHIQVQHMWVQVILNNDTWLNTCISVQLMLFRLYSTHFSQKWKFHVLTLLQVNMFELVYTTISLYICTIVNEWNIFHMYNAFIFVSLSKFITVQGAMMVRDSWVYWSKFLFVLQ